jgi:hypothetical protein
MYASAKFPLTGVYGALASEITRACLLGRLLAWMAWGLFLRAFLTHPWQLSELSSVLAARAEGQEKRGVVYCGKK